jgi:hypothetical protein
MIFDPKPISRIKMDMLCEHVHKYKNIGHVLLFLLKIGHKLEKLMALTTVDWIILTTKSRC